MKLVKEFGLAGCWETYSVFKLQKVSLLVDNKSAIALSKNPVHHDRSKYIDTRYHFVRECIDNGSIDIDHVSNQNQLADILTKHIELRQQLGVIDAQQD
jgi:hypothetical protein